MKSNRLTIFLISIFCLLLSACKKDEKILQKEEKKNIYGTWYSNVVVFKDELNGTSTTTVDYEDFKPAIIQSNLDDLPAQISFNEDGTYTSISHRLAIYFALIGNEKSNNFSYGGTWQFATEGKKLFFDKGVYEFEKSSPRYFDIVKLSADSIILETTDNKAIYDWAILNGKTIAQLDDFPRISNTCSSGSATFRGGQELAAKYANYKGYLDAAKDAAIDFNAFGLGLRKGSVEQFDATRNAIKKAAPIADSCYQLNYSANYQNGANQAKSQIANYKFRTQKLTFKFSRKPNEN